jgi:DNA-nicking Smr family endonuclease
MRSNKAGLADLKRLHQVAQAARAAEKEAAAAAAKTEIAPPAPDDSLAFRRAVRAVQPLSSAERVMHARAAEAPPPRVLARRVAATGITPAPRADQGVGDGDLTHLLSENGTAYVRADVAPDTARRLRKGQWRVGAELDLHGLRVEQARHALMRFLSECAGQGIRCARIVHGKGLSSPDLTPVLKDKVRSWLIQIDSVLAFSDTPQKDGGTGAVVVLLADASAQTR